MSEKASVENHVHVLLAVWGEKFVADFLKFGLFSLLAPGNIPALAKAYHTKFVILTRSQDVGVFERHSAFQKLKSICEVEFIPINDLIVIGNHSTTLTFAYDRAIRQTNDAMLHTYFILLNADYIMAEGSFQGLMKYMKKGYSAICAGNFQVIENEFKPFLKRHIDSAQQVMSIQPRELLKESFQHFHPVTLASFYDENHLHNYRANRFFLRYDRQTLVGRFYLLHVLCIKPETTQYQIGSSFDYSFIPEMCPSGNIGVINDSDDYLVVEMQPKLHELQYVHFGSYDLKKLASGLAEWTTAQHRNNANHVIYYHLNDLLPEMKDKIQAKSDQFVDPLMRGLQKYKAQPCRNHPYWIGAVSAFGKVGAIHKENDNDQYLDLSPVEHMSKWRKLYYRVLGYPPSVNRLHYRWLEYQSSKAVIQKFLSGQDPDKVMALYCSNDLQFMGYGNWLKNDLKMEHHYPLQNTANLKSISETLRVKQFESCLFFVRFQDLKKIKKLLAMMRPMLVSQGKVLILVFNHKSNSSGFIHDFKKRFLLKMNYLISSDYSIVNIGMIHNNCSFLGSMMIKWINAKFDYSKKIRFLFYFFVGIPGLFFVFVRNCISRQLFPKKGHCTAIFVTLDSGIGGSR